MIIFVRALAPIVANTFIIMTALAGQAEDMRGLTRLMATQKESATQLDVDPIDDPQQQAREILTGVAKGQATAVAQSRSLVVEERWAPNIDPQEQARRLILGPPKPGHGACVTGAPARVASPVINRYEHSDPQGLAQKVILGEEATKSPRPPLPASTTQRAD